MTGSAHRDTTDANQSQHSKQQQFRCIVNYAEENIPVYWTA
ncbi:MAG TPA: hypothetical protein VNH18_04320 [Bryobacteraceae bacterium]|nr:hypothetical protein [Bryobacteraceae bacterium]HXJ38479.1 hypothetical protein [Bryobacteraceae bacterium]